ncbi:MAG: hypothetical protein ABFS12_02705 [Bacteroidota bacterium]
MNDSFELILAVFLIIAVVSLFVWLALKLKRGGGSLMTLMYGATNEFYTKDQKNAIEHRVEVKANKKIEEESGEPE